MSMSFAPPWARTKRNVRRLVRGPKLPVALTIAVAISLVLTVVSVAWYSLDGSSRLDLSRPGYESERSEVLTNDTQKTYDTTGAITKSAIDGFLKEYDGRAKDLSSYGRFNDGALDDNNIQLKAQSGATNSATQ